MKEETKKVAAEMLLGESLVKGKVQVSVAAAKEAGRKLTKDEGCYLLAAALSKKPKDEREILAAAKLVDLTEDDKDRILTAFWTSSLLKALEVTGRTISERDFHRLFSRVIKNWKFQSFAITLAKKTGYKLNEQEKKDLLDLVIEEQLERKYDEIYLKDGLEFLGSWLSTGDMYRLFTTLEKCVSPDYPSRTFKPMMRLAKLAKGKVGKDRILKQAALSITEEENILKITEKIVQEVTGEGLTSNDYRYLFYAANKKDKNKFTSKGYIRYNAAFEIAIKHPEILSEIEFTELIVWGVEAVGFLQERMVPVIKAANEDGKLNLETFKDLISEISEWSYDHPKYIPLLVDIHAIALEHGIDIKEIRSKKTEEKKKSKSKKRFFGISGGVTSG